MKYYEIQQTVATGNGSSTTYVLVTNPKVEGFGIHATKVGEPDWDTGYEAWRRKSREFFYRKVDPVDFICVGNLTCIELDNPFGEEEKA